MANSLSGHEQGAVYNVYQEKSLIDGSSFKFQVPSSEYHGLGWKLIGAAKSFQSQTQHSRVEKSGLET
jgi:hypothetical protein